MKSKTVSSSQKTVASGTRKKPVSPKKKAVASTAGKKVITAPKKKSLSSSKKAVASTVKKKPVSPTKKQSVTSNEMMAYVKDAFKGKRIAYFVLDTERKDRAYIVCVAVESEAGFYKLDWGLHCSYIKAKAETALMNKKLGLNEEKVNKIIISTMG